MTIIPPVTPDIVQDVRSLIETLRAAEQTPEVISELADIEAVLQRYEEVHSLVTELEEEARRVLQNRVTMARELNGVLRAAPDQFTVAVRMLARLIVLSLIHI